MRSNSSRIGYALPPFIGTNPERRQSEPRVEATVINNYTKKNKNKGATFEKKSFLISSISAQRASQNVFLMVGKRENTSNILARNGRLGTMPYVA